MGGNNIRYTIQNNPTQQITHYYSELKQHHERFYIWILNFKIDTSSIKFRVFPSN